MAPKITPTPETVVKSVKHTFSSEERNQIGGDLARAIGGLRGIEAEFDQVKASYKAKTAEAEAKIDSLSTNLINGFEMRNKPCVVVFRPAAKKKDFYLPDDPIDLPVLTEDMTRDDFQTELIQAESKFDLREEIQLFQSTETDSGILVVGRFASKWFSALRVKVGKLALEERLDSEQRAFKLRPDAVSHAVKRVSEWAKANMKEHARGFQDSFQKVIEAHQERTE
jgi:hypothetical protein